MGILQPIITIVLFFLILGTLVVIHELGHFLAARAAGVRVLEFGIGFPPRAKVIRSKGETLYTLNWLPIGGFVKLEGEDGDHANDPRAFSSKSLPVRLLILVAGVVMNVVLAFVIFTGIVWLASPQVGAKFEEVQPDSPAAAAGLQPGDAILAIDGQRFQVFVGPDIVDVLRANAGESVTLTVQSPDGGTREVTTTLRDPSQIDEDHGALGIASIGFA
jgi:regulator of sigma E protease